jgi:hypothetical protein
MAGDLLNKFCLKSTYSLRRQLIVSYGCTALCTITLVVLLATIAAIHAGDVVKEQTKDLMYDQAIEGLRGSTVESADLFSKKFEQLRGSAALLVEIVRDRIVGYPNEYEDDQNVPFVDMETGKNKYPLRGPKLPRDFEVRSNWSPDTIAEHAQERAAPLARFVGIMSTRSAQFSFQGNCNPADIDPNGPGYLENCTDANNDPSLGGVLHPVKTLAGLEQPASDISLFLKPLWESEPSAVMTSVYFHNSGAGAILSFPSFPSLTAINYTSAGCEWMRERNPYTGEPYGSDEEIARCSPAGSDVPIRRYNPMERLFCHDQVLHPEEVRIFGPYLDSVWGQWRLTVGQAVYDRK